MADQLSGQQADLFWCNTSKILYWYFHKWLPENPPLKHVLGLCGTGKMRGSFLAYWFLHRFPTTVRSVGLDQEQSGSSMRSHGYWLDIRSPPDGYVNLGRGSPTPNPVSLSEAGGPWGSGSWSGPAPGHQLLGPAQSQSPSGTVELCHRSTAPPAYMLQDTHTSNWLRIQRMCHIFQARLQYQMLLRLYHILIVVFVDENSLNFITT